MPDVSEESFSWPSPCRVSVNGASVQPGPDGGLTEESFSRAGPGRARSELEMLHPGRLRTHSLTYESCSILLLFVSSFMSNSNGKRHAYTSVTKLGDAALTYIFI